MLTITNTLSGTKEPFVPLHKPNVTMYVCGITPYDDAHVGHGRVYVSFDILYRVLQSLGYQVRYCRNLTDIDDKILNKAEKQFGNRLRYADITAPVIEHFRADMNALNCLPPDFEPRVTDNIAPIITFIEKLIAAEKAYVINGDVYFRIRSFPHYGKLSKHKLEDLRAGARVEVDDRKEDPLDFALWKSEPEGEFWKSPWGYGRPGWHIECSALASKYLGSQIDIHAGGLDLIFPHHENEIAQSEALTNKPFATYWMHNGFVQINQEKMSKSLGNFFTLRDIFAKYHPQVLRYYFINHHYKAPLEFSFQDLDMIQKNYQRLTKLLNSVDCKESEARAAQEKSAIITKMRTFILDDLNTPGMLGILFENIDIIKNNAAELCAVKLFLQEICGMTCEPLPETETVITPEIEKLLQEREQARVAKDWARADALRAQLKEMGYDVQDKKIK
jgi:cysteinyl-tRNA synthetase